MPGLPRLATTGVAAAGLLGGAGWVVRYLVVRRRTTATIMLSEMIPVHSAYWRERRRRPGDLLYVALGDSAAQGIGASRPGRGYVGLLARDLRRSTGRTVRVVNLAQSGGRLQDALAKQVPALSRLDPDVVTVSVGANDIATFDVDRFEREVEELFAALPASAIVADLPSFYLGELERRVRQANGIVRAAASRHALPVAPLHRVTARRTAARTALRDVAADFFHPNDRGYEVWASAFRPLLPTALARGGRADVPLPPPDDGGSA
jgi:acyl-CoA thioesterase-1